MKNRIYRQNAIMNFWFLISFNFSGFQGNLSCFKIKSDYIDWKEAFKNFQNINNKRSSLP